MNAFLLRSFLVSSAVAVGTALVACSGADAETPALGTTSEALGNGAAEREIAGSYDGQFGPLKRLTLGGRRRNGQFKNKFVAEISVPCRHDGSENHWPVRPWGDRGDQGGGHGFWCSEEVKGEYHADWRRLELEPNDDSAVSRYARRFLRGRFDYERNGEWLVFFKDGQGATLRREGDNPWGYSCDDDRDCRDEDFGEPACAGEGKWKCKRHSCRFQCEESHRPDPEPSRPWFCTPDRDNVCSYPPRTPGIEETFPGGLCDPNGDGGYDDADWVQGYFNYQSVCAR